MDRAFPLVGALLADVEEMWWQGAREPERQDRCGPKAMNVDKPAADREVG